METSKWPQGKSNSVGISDGADEHHLCIQARPQNFQVVAKYIFNHSWLVVGIPTPLKNDGLKVNWDDDIPNWMESHKNVPNHQPGSVLASWEIMGKTLGKSWKIWVKQCHKPWPIHANTLQKMTNSELVNVDNLIDTTSRLINLVHSAIGNPPWKNHATHDPAIAWFFPPKAMVWFATATSKK